MDWENCFYFLFALKFETMHIYNMEDPTKGFFEGSSIATEIRSQDYMFWKISADSIPGLIVLRNVWN